MVESKQQKKHLTINLSADLFDPTGNADYRQINLIGPQERGNQEYFSLMERQGSDQMSGLNMKIIFGSKCSIKVKGLLFIHLFLTQRQKLTSKVRPILMRNQIEIQKYLKRVLHCSSKFDTLADYITDIIVRGWYFKVGLQCRVKPSYISMCKTMKSNFVLSPKKKQFIRPYGIIIKKIDV